jgi:hypothetical protein
MKNTKKRRRLDRIDDALLFQKVVYRYVQSKVWATVLLPPIKSLNLNLRSTRRYGTYKNMTD